MRAAMFAPPISRPFLEARLGDISGLTLSSARNEAEAIDAVASAEILIMPQQYMSSALAKAINAASELKWIQLLTAGTEKLETVELRSDLVFTSGSGGLAPTVAEHAVSLLLALARQIPEILSHQGQKQWHVPIKEHMVSLYGKTIAIVGFGAIGQEVAKRLRPFGVRIIGLSRRGLPNDLADKIVPTSELDNVIESADAIVLALPLTKDTNALFNGDRLRLCRVGAYLVNVGRGKVIDSNALADALRNGSLGGAAIDVTDPEPLPEQHALWTAPNLIITPHCAAGGGYPQLADFVARNIERYVSRDEIEGRISMG